MGSRGLFSSAASLRDPKRCHLGRDSLAWDRSLSSAALRLTAIHRHWVCGAHMRFFGELATGNPVLLGYLAYIAGLLIAIAAVKAS
jgi:hypothetical protein